MRWVVWFVALGGCDQLFGLKSTVLADGGAPIDAPPAITAVQVAPDEQKVTTLTVPFKMPVVAHDTVVAAVYAETTTVPTVSDSLGNTYQELTGPYPFVPYAAANANMYLFVALNVRGGTASVTAATPDATDVLLVIHELANVVSIEGASGATGSGIATDGMTSGPITTAGSNDLIFGFGVGFTTSAGTGFTVLSSFAANVTEARVVTAPGMYPALATDLEPDPTRSGWTMLGAVFRGP